MPAADRSDYPTPEASPQRVDLPPIVALVVMTAAAAMLGILIANQPVTRDAAAAPDPSGSPTPQARPSPAPLPNDGWFIPAPKGMQLNANEVIDDPDTLALYLGRTQAEAIIDSGFHRVRMRSYSAGASGDAALEIMEVNDPTGLLRRLRRAGDGLGEPYADLPRARLHGDVVQMESTRAHDVFAHFRTVTFLSDPYVVEVRAYALNGDVAQRRAAAYARAQHELLQARSG